MIISSNRYSVFFLFTAFAMLWMPLGQHNFLFEHWMKLGTFMAPFLLLVAFAFRKEQAHNSLDHLPMIAIVLFAAYIAHQFEEHWIDLYGNKYAFKAYVNNLVLDQLGVVENVTPPLSDAGIFVINTSLVWFLASLAICFGARHSFPILCLNAIVLVNALSHISAASLSQTYNPGLATSMVVFMPLSVLTYMWFLRTKTSSFLEFAASFIWGVSAHIIMIIGMIMSGYLKLMSETAYFVILVGWSLLPVFLFRPKQVKS